MKKITFLLLTVLTLIACQKSGQEMDSARAFLRNEANAANTALAGTQIDFATVCDRCEFINDDFHYYYTIDENYVSIADMEANKEDIKNMQRSMFENIPQVNPLAENLSTIGGKVIFHYTGNMSGSSTQIELDF